MGLLFISLFLILVKINLQITVIDHLVVVITPSVGHI